MKRLKKRFLVKRIIGFSLAGLLLITSLTLFFILTLTDVLQTLNQQIVLVILSPVMIILSFFVLILTFQVRTKLVTHNGYQIMVYTGNISRYLLVNDEIVDSQNIISSAKQATYGNLFKSSECILNYICDGFEINVVIGLFNHISISFRDNIATEK